MLTSLLSLSAGLIFVGISCAAPAPATGHKSIWGITIWREPAPSPEDGPPASANALRDPHKLKYEVTGIVCAYIAWVLLTAVVIIIIGRRIQRKEQGHKHRSGIKMFKSSGKVTHHEIEAGPRSPFGPMSPKSPGALSSIKSWAKGQNKVKGSEISSPTFNTRIDERVVDEDKSRNMDEMAKLYAAVMAHDEGRVGHKGQSSTGSSPVIDQISPVTPKSPSYPPEMAHPAYLPPGSPGLAPNSHFEPMDSMEPATIATDSDEQRLLIGESTPRRTKNGALSILSSSASRMGSSQSSNKARPSPITVRGQPISKPLGSADLRQSAFSPKTPGLPSSVYSPGPPPPTPGRTPARPVEEIEMHGRPQLTSLASDSSQTQPKVLPFRQYQDPLKSAPATKTTFLDRRTSALGGPKTGVPKTPYSPYCPTTPMTPITPRRLPNKEEIKKAKKQYAMQVVKENELVQSDNDMWGTD